jgi:hypothetical protein
MALACDPRHVTAVSLIDALLVGAFSVTAAYTCTSISGTACEAFLNRACRDGLVSGSADKATPSVAV